MAFTQPSRRLCRRIRFDLAYHVTFGRFWSPSLFALLPVPFVWGGVGGGEVVSRAMRPCLEWKDRLMEWIKEMVFGLYRFDPFVQLTALVRLALILANHPPTARRLAALSRSPVEYMETAVVDKDTWH